jgi:hypothetical protein
MRNVRFARALLALALITPVALTAAPVAAQDTQYATDGQADEARADMMQVFGMTDLAPGQYKWASDIPAAGQTKIVISLTDQLGRSCNGSTIMASRFMAGTTPAIPRATAASGCR